MQPSPTNDRGPYISVRRLTPGGVVFIGFTSHNVYAQPVFEFARQLADIEVGQVMLRDPQRRWYHGGVPGAGTDIEDLRHALARLLSRHRPRRTITLGTSAGGYAALLFGRLLEVDHVLAFAPQTRLVAPGDSRTPVLLDALHSAVGADHHLLDLRHIPAAAEDRTRVDIYYSRHDALDCRHALHLSGQPGVVLHELDCEGHRIIPQLKHTGALGRILRQAAFAP